MKKIFFLVLFSFSLVANAQSKLKPGFDANEYMDMVRASSYFLDSLYPTYVLPLSANYQKVYRSPVVGLQNRFDIWLKDGNVGIICIRGSVAKTESWIENFYMGMIANEGQIFIDKNHVF